MPKRLRVAILLFLLLGAAGLGWRTGIFQHRSQSQNLPSKAAQAPIQPAKTLSEMPSRPPADSAPDQTLLESGLVSLKLGSGAVRRYRLALNEIYEMTPGKEGVRSIPAQKDAQALTAYAAAKSAAGATWPGLVLYPENGPVEKATLRVLTGKMLVELADATSSLPDLSAAGLVLVERPDYAPRHLITRSHSGSPLEALAAIQKLRGDASVASVTPLLKRAVQAAATPNDPLFPTQWHLANAGQTKGVAGMDAQVPQVWDQYRGAGIQIGIVDTGIQKAHPDLLANVSEVGHMELIPRELASYGEDVEGHGTCVAGVVAATQNNLLGGSGVAPEATLFSLRILNGESLVDDSEIARVVRHGNEFIRIKNNSWGWFTGPAELGESGPLFQEAMSSAASQTWGGLGMISIWSSGNSRQIQEQGNKGGLANDIHAIAVGAVTNTGKLASYSEIGTHLTCVAPSGGGTLGIVTTDMTGIQGYNPDPIDPDLEDYNYSYTRNMSGTSFSAPVVTGVVALMLEANPNLNWREVKEILLRSSLKLEPTSPGWISRVGGRAGDEMLPPIKHHTSYGGGLVQAKNAVEMARIWHQQGHQLGAEIRVEKKIDPNLSLNYSGTQPEPKKSFQKLSSIVTPPKPPKRRTLISKFDMRGIQPMRVENVAITLDISHTYRGDLGIILRSPSGVVSTLVSPTPWDWGTDYPGILLSSMRHWGESGQGIWTLEITDYSVEDDGTFASANLVITGSAAPAAQITSQPTAQLLAEGNPVTLEVASTLSSEGGIRVWRKDGKEIPKQVTSRLENIGLKLTDAGSYDHLIHNKWGFVASQSIPIAVVRREIPGIYLNEGKTHTFSAVASGANLLYQWFRTGVTDPPLVDNGRVTGTSTPKLTIREAAPRDEDTYYCRVRLMNYNPLPDEVGEEPVVVAEIFTQPAQLQIRRRPVINASTLNTAITVSEPLLRQITADNEVTRWSVTGLPPGVTFDPKTARILGSPTKAGRYTLTLTAFNAAGTSTPVTVIWDVQALPASIIGTYHGIVERHDLFNGGFGGAVTLTTTSTGSYTGSVTRGVHRHSFSGRLIASSTPGSSVYTEIALTRRAPFGPLTFRIDLTANDQWLHGAIYDPTVSGQVADVMGQRAAFSTANPATSYVGRWNSAYELIPALVGNSTYPQGASWGTQTISATGTSSLTARLADGTTLTSSSGLSFEGRIFMHQMLYGNFGSAQGTQTLDRVARTASAEWTWLKAPGTSSRSYAGGFPVHDLIGTGAAYTPPARGEMLFGITPALNNARLTFTEGGLAGPFVQNFTLGLGNVLAFPTGSANPHQVKFTQDLNTGILTGTGAAMDINPLNPALNRQRPGTFSALLIPGREQAVGHFLLPSSTSTTSPILSGKVIGAENIVR